MSDSDDVDLLLAMIERLASALRQERQRRKMAESFHEPQIGPVESPHYGTTAETPPF